MKLHHVGIVVKNIQESLGELTKYLDFEETSVPIEVESQRVNVCFLKTSSVYIELIEPAETETPITSFLEKNGPGIHHLGFEVEDIKNEITKLRQKGGLVVCKPVLGFENRLISFIFMDSLPFKLIEIFSMPKQNNSI